MGREAAQVLLQRLEEQLPQPLDEVRAALDIMPFGRVVA